MYSQYIDYSIVWVFTVDCAEFADLRGSGADLLINAEYPISHSSFTATDVLVNGLL